jgi:peptide/nickel transport system substrate-binding protein
MSDRTVTSKIGATLAGLVVAGALAGPADAENILRFVGFSGGALTLDPHSYYDTPNRVAIEQVYEALLDVDSYLKIVPQLALAWQPLDETTWEFELRPNVRFHDGTPLTAEDVVFSIGRARYRTSDLSHLVNNIAELEMIDDHTVRVTTAGPDPLLWLKLSHVAIMSKDWAEQHSGTNPADFKAREETYTLRHANGTGPFVVEEFEPGGRYVLVRNSAWWGTAEYPHNIDRIVHTWTGDPEADVQALINREIDLLHDPPYASLDLIRSTPGLKLGSQRKLLTQFFGLDQGSAELRSSDIKGRNPFKDVRVRRAMYHALDIHGMLDDLLGELLIPAGMVIAPGVNGYAPELDQRLPYDPRLAKTLLAEAGYPDGFRVTLDCPNEWGDDEIAMCQGARKQLRKVSIEVVINFGTSDEHYAKIFTRRESDFYLDAWDTDPDSGPLLRKLYHSQGSWNGTGYANPNVDDLIEQIETAIVTYARDAYLEEAWRIVVEDVVYLPVRHSVTLFAMREKLELPVDPWNIPRFRLARFKEVGG